MKYQVMVMPGHVFAQINIHHIIGFGKGDGREHSWFGQRWTRNTELNEVASLLVAFILSRYEKRQTASFGRGAKSAPRNIFDLQYEFIIIYLQLDMPCPCAEPGGAFRPEMHLHQLHQGPAPFGGCGRDAWWPPNQVQVSCNRVHRNSSTPHWFFHFSLGW